MIKKTFCTVTNSCTRVAKVLKELTILSYGHNHAKETLVSNRGGGGNHRFGNNRGYNNNNGNGYQNSAQYQHNNNNQQQQQQTRWLQAFYLPMRDETHIR
ncbi:unnamed protein product [Adineta steineri]|uniref:Uncharacterized protein n=1 Tax=Adineta steineri TaxID=433720 RepID=A0A814CLD8_9BILA|nr:unnamed protein product [Adineta steineri]